MADDATPPAPTLAPDLIEACYRLLLGRAPENDQVVADKAALPGYEALLSAFLECEEYSRRAPMHLRRHYFAPAADINVAAPPEALARLFERIRGEWSKLGDSDPYWSVLTEEAYRKEAMGEEVRRQFFESGAESAGLIDLMADRAGVTPPYDGVCVELGCGVGRVTAHLAKRFAKVIAVDISAGNLAICKEVLAQEGIGNVETRLIGSPADIEDLPGFDFFFSTIVLQHNPPPVQHYLLDRLLAKLSPRGGCLFQAPTATPGYSFDLEDYLASEAGGMEMHCLPMPRILRLMARHGVTPLEVAMDDWTGLYGSYTFFGVGADAL